MTATIHNIRDYQSRQAIERAHKALEEHLAIEANQIMNEALFGMPAAMVSPDFVQIVDSMFGYQAPERDPA